MSEIETVNVTQQSSAENKPRLSLKQIMNMSVGFFGIQFGFALQNANVSRIFETLGAEIDKIGFYGSLHLLQVCWYNLLLVI